ncbi:MAG: hypothetical protein J6C93_05285 [Clostridia bacterium]|nr:hypothetical protein [Clostridia bacterium]
MKKSVLIGGLAVASLTCATLAACSGGNYPLSNNEPYVPVQPVTFEMDAGGVIDGLANESFYGDSTVSFTETVSGITVTSKVHMGEKGIFLYGEADDKSVYFSEEKQFFENDSIEFCLDPDRAYSFTREGLSLSNPVRRDCLQIRINACGEYETWYGLRIGGASAYPWARGYFPVAVSTVVNGEMNVANGADGYSVEAFIPWEAFEKTEKPTSMGVMPAFNNVNNREDTSRTWFSCKGMSHAYPTSYAEVDENGYVDVGLSETPLKALTADWNDEAYLNQRMVEIKEVTAQNENPARRAAMRSYLGEDGVYFSARVYDVVYSWGSDNIWANDGIELYVDKTADGGGDIYAAEVLRVGVDIDGGIEINQCRSDYQGFIPVRGAAFAKTSVKPFTDQTAYHYAYEYVYEVMIPYSTLGLTEAPNEVSFGWAVKSPDEKAYVLDRMDVNGNMEGQDWLWADRHYPQNPDEYYIVEENGISAREVERYTFPAWAEWGTDPITSQAPNRYKYRGRSAADGLYFNYVQYVDTVVRGAAQGDWSKLTHLELELWNANVGWGWGGTYLAFFTNGSHYINNSTGVTQMECDVTITDRGEGYAQGYRYEISYEVYIGFQNVGDPNVWVQFMSYTPGEGADGYENATQITKDEGRILWTDDRHSVGFGLNGIPTADARPAGDTAIGLTFDTKTGATQIKNNKLISTAMNTVAVTEGAETFEFSADVAATNALGAGLVFGYSETDGSYYYFYARSSDWTVGLVRVTQDGEELLYSNYLSASYQYKNAYRMEVEIEDGQYTCYFWNNRYCIGTLAQDAGNGVGVRAIGAGSQFLNFAYAQTVTSPTADTVIIGHSYMELWTNYASDLSGANLGSIANLGVSGSVAEDWEKMADSVVAYAPSTVIYMIGINDLFRSIAVQTVADRVENTLLSMKEELPALRVVLLSVNECNEADDLTAEIDSLNALYREICQTYDWILYADVDRAFNGAFDTPQASWFTDGLHPTADGYTQKIAPAIKDALQAKTFEFSAWTAWENCAVQSQAPTRYNFRGYAADEGLYLNVVQYVDSYVIGAASGVWRESTHIEIKAFNHGVGYGWGGTYYAFFLDGSYYVNSLANTTDFRYDVSVTDRGANAEGYRYEISYEIYVGFANNVGSADGPYAYVKFMSLTPGEGADGYENATTVTEGDRVLWTDTWVSHEIRAAGIIRGSAN